MAYPHGYVKRNFFTGQFDREFSGQENAISAAGMVYCRNVMTSPEGECKARPGTEFLSSINQEAVIIPYRRSGQDLALVFTDLQLNVKTFNEIGQLVDFVPAVQTMVTWTNTDNNTPDTTPVSIKTDTTDIPQAFRFWTETPYNLIQNYNSYRIYAPQGKYPMTYFNMRFTEKKALNKFGMKIIRADGDFSIDAIEDAKNWINNAALEYSDDGTSWTTVPLVRPVQIASGRTSTPYGNRMVPGIYFEPLETALHEYWRVVVVWDGQKMPGVRPFMVSFQGLVYEETASEPQTLSTPYTTDLLKKLKYSQMYGSLIICDGNHRPYEFSMIGNTPAFVQKNYTFMETDGNPSCVRYFQNRLYYGGFASYPVRVRGSRFGDYGDFQVVTQDATVADPVNVECNQFNERITDLWGGFTVLYAQSSEGVAFVTGMSSTPDFSLRCSQRASGITPIMKDNIMYYVGYDRRKIYAFSFDNNIQQFVAPDVSFYWQEVLKNRVSEIHYIDSRCKCIVGNLEDGTGFFLFHEGKDIGYFPFDINGKITDLSIIKDGDDTHVIMVVQRNDDWTIERLHMPEFMRTTNAFEQSGWERNLATQENLLKSPFFDSWKVLKDEHQELWQYDAETKIITPIQEGVIPIDLSSYIGKYIRCYYGNGIRDYTDVKLQRVYTEQHTEEREIEVTDTVYYYCWQNTTAVNVSAISGYSPAWNGRFTRDAAQDSGGWRAFVQGSYVGYSSGFNPAPGDSFYSHGGRGYYAKATISSVEQTTYWTRGQTPSAGDPVFDNDYNQIGTIDSVTSDGIVVNGVLQRLNSTKTKYRTETHTETIEVVVEGGQYAVECDLTEDTVFNKIQLPIESIETTEPKIQVQDNGVYKGTFESQDGIVTFEEPMYNIQYGIPYRKIAVIEDNRSYLRQKEWGAIAVNIIDTMSLKVGIKLDKLTNMVKWDGKQFFDSNLIMKNGTLICNIKDIPQYEKQLIFMTDEGLPFTILAIETAGDISDRGAN